MAPDMLSKNISDKIKNFIFYHGKAAAAVTAAIAAVLFLLGDMQKDRPEEALFVMAAGMELPEQSVQAVQKELIQALGLDEKTKRCVLETVSAGSANMESEASMSAYMRSGRVDLFIAPEEVFNRYAAAGYLLNLEQAQEEIGAVFIQNQKEEDLFYASLVDYSRGGAVKEIPFHPHEKTADAGCYGIYLKEGIFDGCAAGIMANCPNEKYVNEGLQYFLEGPDQAYQALGDALIK